MAKALLRSKNRFEIAEKLDHKHKWPSVLPPMHYDEANLKVCEAIFDALDLPTLEISDDRSPGVLLHFSAFLTASMFGKMPAYDVLAFTRPFDKAATRETLKGFIGVSGLDIEKLRSDAHRLRSYLKLSSDTNLFHLATDVDPPAIDWTSASNLKLDIDKIEASLYHPSQWIVWLAVNLIENLLPRSELNQVVRRLFENGKGHTLWAACGLASELNQDEAVSLLFERLSAPLNSGCEYLFKLLRQFPLQWGPELCDILSNGLKGDVDIAKEAAQLTINIAKPGHADLAALLYDAFVYWIEHEEPYPMQGGVIPDSPRATLLDSLTRIKPPSYPELRLYTSDPRSDVRNIAAGKLIEWLRLSDGPRRQFIEDICAEALPSNLLSKALESMTPLNPEEIALWEKMLDSKNSKIRYNAMSLLQNGNLDPTRIHTLAHAMTEDNEQQIRDRAYRILDML